MTTQYIMKATHINSAPFGTVNWVVTGAPDNTGAQSGYNTADLTSIAVDYTSSLPITTTGGQTLSTNSWITALDLDFTAQPTQSITTDGTYTIAGYTFTKINSANESTHLTLTNGQGLVFTPGPSGDIFGGNFSAPGLQIPLTSLIPNLDSTTPVRVWMYISSDNAAANYDNTYLSIANGTNLNYTVKRGFNGSLNISTNLNINAGNVGQLTPGTSYYAADNVLVFECPDGVTGGKFISYGGTYGSGWPAVSSLDTLDRFALSTQQDLHFSGKANAFNLVFGAHKAGGGSGTVYVPHIARIKVEYLSQQLSNFAPIVLSDVFANLPSPGVSGRLFVPTDSNMFFRDNGIAWQGYGHVAPVKPITPLSNWTPFNFTQNFSQASAPTATPNSTAVTLFFPNSGSNQNIQGYEQAFTAPQSFTVLLYPQLTQNNYCGVGTYLRNSTTGHIVNFQYTWSGSSFYFVVGHYNGPTDTSHLDVFATNTLLPQFMVPLWMKIQDDGTNHIFSFSTDGFTFIQLFSEAKSIFFGGGSPNKAGIGGNTFTANAQGTFYSAIIA